MTATMTWTDAKTAFIAADAALRAAPAYGPEKAAAAKVYHAAVRALVAAGQDAADAGTLTAADEQWFSDESARAPRGVATAWMI